MNMTNGQRETQIFHNDIYPPQNRKRFQIVSFFFVIIVMIFIFEAAFGGLFLPQKSIQHGYMFVEGADDNDGVITVMTLNMRHGRGMNGLVQLDEIAKLIKESAADIVGLQEVDRYWLRSGRVDQVKWLGEELGMAWYYAPTIRFGRVQYGNAILSKYPLLWNEMIALPGKREGRNVMRVLVIVDGQPWLIYNTHLGVRLEERENQFPQLMQALSSPLPSSSEFLQRHHMKQPAFAMVHTELNSELNSKMNSKPILKINDEPSMTERPLNWQEVFATNVDVPVKLMDLEDAYVQLPAVLLGDFNMEASHELFMHMDNTWTWAEVDEPTHIHGSQIDHVFVSPHIRILDTSVIETDATDHAPVVVKLKLRLQMDKYDDI